MLDVDADVLNDAGKSVDGCTTLSRVSPRHQNSLGASGSARFPPSTVSRYLTESV